MRAFFNLPNFLIFVLFPLIGIGLIPYFQHELSPDGMSYYSIAVKYFSGNFSEAINGYWSPLLSWILLPFLMLKVPHILAMKIISILVIVLLCWRMKKLAKEFNLSYTATLFLIITAYFLTLPFGFIFSTPDLLLLLILLHYFICIFSPGYIQQKHSGLTGGMWGALAYFCKAYAFYFFLIHFTLCHLLFRLKDKQDQKAILRNYLSGMVVFLALSSIWISALSYKYKKFTISTSGQYNLSIMADGNASQYMEFAGILPPPNSTAISSWEDPSLFKINHWNPFASKKDLIRLSKNVYDNFKRIYWHFLDVSSLSLALLLFLFFQMVRRKNITEILASKYGLLLITILLYSVGYCFLIIEKRYFLAPFLLIVLTAALLLDDSALLLPEKWKRISLALLVGAMFIIPSLDYLRWNVHPGKEEFEIAQELKNTYGIKGGKIVSDSKWYKGLFIAYFLDGRYYGMPETPITKEKLLNDLKKYQIDYYIDWKESGPDFTLEEFQDITGNKNSLYRLYKINP